MEHTHGDFNNWLYLRCMKQMNRNIDHTQKPFVIGFALLFCVFFSSLDYLNSSFQETVIEQQEQGSQDENQTFVSVEVDAVVPFALHLSQTAFRLIYELVDSGIQRTSIDSVPFGYSASLGEVFFERIISPQGP